MTLHKRSQRLSDPKAEKPLITDHSLKLDSPLQDRPGPEAAEDGEGDQVAAGHRHAGAAPGDRGRGSHDNRQGTLNVGGESRIAVFPAFLHLRRPWRGALWQTW